MKAKHLIFGGDKLANRERKPVDISIKIQIDLRYANNVLTVYLLRT